MVRVRRVVEASYLAASQNDLTDRLRVAGSAFKQVAQVKSTKLIFVGAYNRVVAHCHQGDLLGVLRLKRLCGGLRRDQRRRIEMLGAACSDDTLGSRARALRDRLSGEV